jgi:hypothetical protein
MRRKQEHTRPRLPITSKVLSHRSSCGSGTESGVAIHVERPKSSLSNHRESVVLFSEELARGVEGDAVSGELVDNKLGFLDDELHRFIPGGGLELAGLLRSNESYGSTR